MAADERVQVHAATPDRWNDVVAVMGERGDPSRCWCQFFRLRGKEWQAATPTTNRARLRNQVFSSEHPPGVVAYVDDQPVGWCATAPKQDYPRVLASRVTGADSDGIWAVTCFVVRVGLSWAGRRRALLQGAVDLARSAAASVVEAYPVDPSARSSVTAGELYHGPLSVFRDAGFTEVQRPSSTRAIVQLALKPARPDDP